MTHLKSFDWVARHLNDENVRLIDCRFQLNNPQAGLEAYKESHLPNSVYLDLEKDLSGPIEDHGGRHPLPNIQEISNKLSQLGIDENVMVVAYDDQNGAMASRCWWLLKYLGHENVFIMNGTFKNWVNQQLPVSTQVPIMTKRHFKATIQNQLLVGVDDVNASLNDQDITLIDSREEPRYRGEVEPIDKVAGHIPGALNYFWQENVNSDGSWKDTESHQKRFEGIPKHQPIIVYCGSGVTACPNILALKEAGYQDVKLYAGSWSDWISYKDHPIGKR